MRGRGPALSPGAGGDAASTGRSRPISPSTAASPTAVTIDARAMCTFHLPGRAAKFRLSEFLDEAKGVLERLSRSRHARPARNGVGSRSASRQLSILLRREQSPKLLVDSLIGLGIQFRIDFGLMIVVISDRLVDAGRRQMRQTNTDDLFSSAS